MDDVYLKSCMDDLDYVIGCIYVFLQKCLFDVKGMVGEILVCDNIVLFEFV